MSECRVRFEAHVLAKKKDASWLEKEPTDPKRSPWPGEYAVVQTEVEWRAWKAGWESALDNRSDLIAKLTILAERLGGEAGAEIRKVLGVGTTQEDKAMNEWEMYRNAGEIFGRVEKGVKFGEVSMRNDRQLGGFNLWWRFNAGGKPYGIEHCVSYDEIRSIGFVEILAKMIVDRWQSEARQKIGSYLYEMAIANNP